MGATERFSRINGVRELGDGMFWSKGSVSLEMDRWLAARKLAASSCATAGLGLRGLMVSGEAKFSLLCDLECCCASFLWLHIFIQGSRKQRLIGFLCFYYRKSQINSKVEKIKNMYPFGPIAIGVDPRLKNHRFVLFLFHLPSLCSRGKPACYLSRVLDNYRSHVRC